MTRRILFLVNGLGLGNSTRCHAIIERLLEQGVDVSVVTSGNGLWYFEGRLDARRLHGIEALYYASRDGRLSVSGTLLALREFWRIAQRNAKRVEMVLDDFRPDAVLIDSVYTTEPMRRRGISIIALNNADVVHLSYRRFKDRPRSIRAQFYTIEEMDYLFHRLRADLVLSPNLDATLPQVGGNVTRVGPIVRRGYEPSLGFGPVRRVLIMLSGSRFGTQVSLRDRAFPFHIDIVGRETPKDIQLPPNIVFYGRLRDNAEIANAADIVIVNGGFSAVSETFMMRKPMVVLPIPNHAEQWVNGRTIAHLGVGFMADEDSIEMAMMRAIDCADELRSAYGRLPPPRDGATEAAEHILDFISSKKRP
jgi:UDP:flavonoid glycosyltransferase YjiC (YdhE family)